MTQLPIALDLLAIATGGLFGSAIAVQRRMPLVAVMLIGILMALGGGMLRDLLLDVPVVAVHNEWYIPTAVFAALIGMPLARRTVENSIVGLTLDGLVLGTYVLVGTQKAVLLGMPVGSSIFVGVLTAVGGGTIAEVMLGSKPNVLRDGPWFASAALVGAVIVVLGHGLIDPSALAAITITIVAVIRITSVRLGYTAPSVANIQRLRRNRAS
jgi:uncharacterized membrane protein YeiH